MTDLDAIGTPYYRSAGRAHKVPDGLVAKLALLPRLLEVDKFPPRVRGGTPSCQTQIWRGEEIDLGRLPILTCWPRDGGPYITLPMVISRDPIRGIRATWGCTGCRSWARVRWPCTGSATKWGPPIGARWRSAARRCQCASPSEPTPRRCTRRARRCRRRWTSSCSPGSCVRAPVSLARAVSCDLEVPAEAEFVIEGYIDPREPLVTEGPFGDHTGFYSRRTCTPRSTSPPSPRGPTLSMPRPSWVGPRWRTIIWDMRRSGSSYRCCG